MTMGALPCSESSDARSAIPPSLVSTVMSPLVTPEEFEIAPPEDLPFGSSCSSSATEGAYQPASVVSIHGRADRTKARFRLLRRLQKNHDSEGAAAADCESVDAAIAFVGSMQCSKPYFATLNDDGFAVIEFEDRETGFFGDLTFQPGGFVRCYARQPGAPSRFLEQALDSPEMRDFLDTHIGVVF